MKAWLIAGLAACVATVSQGNAAEMKDPYVWLEEMSSPRALEWARAENAKTLPRLQNDPRYKTFETRALEVLTATDRIPAPDLRGEEVDNFWQDREHVRGVWRRTNLSSYRTAAPHWRTVLDVDALAKAENANWVFEGYDCLEPEERLCLVNLSEGGKDAYFAREFDAVAGKFVDGGFRLPEAKHSVVWRDKDSLIVATEWTPGDLTVSGYPYIVKELRRGERLSAARELYRGEKKDVGVSPLVLRDAAGAPQAVLFQRSVDFHHSETLIMTERGPVKIGLPDRHALRAFVGGQVVFALQEDWAGTDFKAGDMISFDLDDLKRAPGGAKAELVIRPGERQSIKYVATTKSALVLALYDNVRGAALVYSRVGGEWVSRKLDLPAFSSVRLGSRDKANDRLFLYTAGFLEPDVLWLADTASAKVERVKAAPRRYDSSNLAVDQFEATSKDGTKIPYFVVRRKDIRYDGSNPTLLYAYGGFEVSMTPSYSGVMGRLWLERGGVYILANIRGGGEFGPKWHTAGLKENRQRVYDDFFAVAEDAIARKITSPRRLGAMGGSNGGLLMGVALTQRPDLFNALVIQVPLFDMIRYPLIGAGQSWVGEYGDPDIPGERAVIERYSPYQNLAAGKKYPEVFLSTSTKDDRVHPAHARKAAARLAELGYSYFYYENIDGGHAGAANLNERAMQSALDYTYLSQKLMD